MERYTIWLSDLKQLMLKAELISEDVILSPEGYRPYFDEGKTPYETLREEFGEDWVKAYQKWFFTANQSQTPPQK